MGSRGQAAREGELTELFVGLDMPASNAWTCERLGWTPNGPGLIADLTRMDYGVALA